MEKKSDPTRLASPASHLVAGRCENCGKILFPIAGTCKQCLGNNIQNIQIGNAGRLYSYSIIYIPAMGLNAPYAIGYVDVSEGLRLFSLLINWKENELTPGRKMELVSMETGTSYAVKFAYQPLRMG